VAPFNQGSWHPDGEHTLLPNCGLVNAFDVAIDFHHVQFFRRLG